MRHHQECTEVTILSTLNVIYCYQDALKSNTRVLYHSQTDLHERDSDDDDKYANVRPDDEDDGFECTLSFWTEEASHEIKVNDKIMIQTDHTNYACHDCYPNIKVSLLMYLSNQSLLVISVI